MGRRKIEIEPLTDDRNRTVTFVKRKAGLFKKAHELAVLCQVDLAVIIVGNNNKVYEFSTVDTNEILQAYENTMNTRKQLHESKSPENYSDYKKKRHLHEPLTNKAGTIVGTNAHLNDESDHNVVDDDSENDSDDSPQPKRHKKSDSISKIDNQNPKIFNSTQPPPPPPPPHISLNNAPTFNNPKKYKKSVDEGSAPILNTKSEETPSQRPVLRVQIPTDAKGSKNGNPNDSTGNSDSKDTARTITAVDNSALNQTGQLGSGSSGNNLQNNNNNNINSNHSNNNSSQPHSNGTHGLIPGAIPNTKFTGFSSFRSPDSRKPTLPLPLHTKSQTSSPASASAPGLPLTGGSSVFYSGMQQSPQGNTYANYPAQVYQQFQQFQQQLQQQGAQQPGQQNPPPSALSQATSTAAPAPPPSFQLGGTQTSQPESAIRFRPAGTQFNNGEQTPISGLPSRYVNDMFPFPSPSNFLAPQDWPTGMTPTTHIPQYFMNMPLSSTGQQAPGLPAVSIHQQQQPQQQSQPGYKPVNLASTMFQIPSQGTNGVNSVGKISEAEQGTNPTTAGSSEDNGSKLKSEQ